MINLEKTQNNSWASIVEEVEQALALGKKVVATLENGKTMPICEIVHEGHANINEQVISFCID